MSDTETDRKLDALPEEQPLPKVKGTLTISEPSLLIDANGNCWWIDARTQLLKRVYG